MWMIATVVAVVQKTVRFQLSGEDKHTESKSCKAAHHLGHLPLETVQMFLPLGCETVKTAQPLTSSLGEAFHTACVTEQALHKKIPPRGEDTPLAHIPRAQKQTCRSTFRCSPAS